MVMDMCGTAQHGQIRDRFKGLRVHKALKARKEHKEHKGYRE
jgi:hypothetical protein